MNSYAKFCRIVILRSAISFVFIIGSICGIAAQSPSASSESQSNIRNVPLADAEVNRIINAFTQHEKEFREALTNYVFNRYATINTIGLGGQITGTFRRDSFMTLSKDGRRLERILFAPVPTTPPGFVTPEDLEDLGGVNPFALEPSAIDQYRFRYLGKEKIDELDLYVFDVVPKAIPDPKKSKLRLFVGRIWVDDRDLMIVKSKGKAVPETKDNKFPVVETWRENIDGKYWFPSYASSDDQLVFDNGSVVNIRMRVRFTDYKLARTDVIIGDEETPSEPPKKP
ncbi:MAG TPA: hypothetical protein VNK26_00765 [Pyrinomonadaceae bacterium]|jgi:hypothetical protein|nr:hypothetical protein [Pyrinomonadaceae bacterium]